MTAAVALAHELVSPPPQTVPAAWSRVTARPTRRRPVPALRLTGIRKSFHTRDGERCVLGGIDLDVAPGEVVCLVGPRGAGTSMLLSIAAGFESATQGTVGSLGKRVRRPGDDRPLLFRDAGLLPWLHARGNVELALRDSHLPAFERAAIARRCLDLVSLHRFEDTPARELSDANQQRVALARALAVEPAVLLMDEPFVHAEGRTRERLHDELQAVWTATRTAILFATHDPEEAVILADRLLVLAPPPGRIVAEIAIDLPRPRSASDDAVRARARAIEVGIRRAAA